MRLEKINIMNYRNITAMELTPNPGVNIIYGDNAQGKTNLIESIWMFTGAKNFRGGKEKEILQIGCNKCTTEVTFFCGGRQQTSKIELISTETPEKGIVYTKSVTLNEIPLKSASQLSGHFFSVLFSPAHLSLVRDGPAERRQFLDTAIGQIVPKYHLELKEYQHILVQRNALLKDIYKFPQLSQTAEVWEEHLAKRAAGIIQCRARYLNKLAVYAENVYYGISGGKEQLQVSYKSSCASSASTSLTQKESEEGNSVLAQQSREQIKKIIMQKLGQNRSTDIERGTTSIGPHRDDVELLVNDMPMRLYGSQGQQRSGVLALKMAECRMIEEATGEPPLLLLDDVMSELDAQRRDYLLNQIKDHQVFITCCDQQTLENLKEGKSFHVEGGDIT